MRRKSGEHYKQCMEASSAFRSAAKHPPKHRPAPAVWVPVTENCISRLQPVTAGYS